MSVDASQLALARFLQNLPLYQVGVARLRAQPRPVDAEGGLLVHQVGVGLGAGFKQTRQVLLLRVLGRYGVQLLLGVWVDLLRARHNEVAAILANHVTLGQVLVYYLDLIRRYQC